jgi:abhydrolase domain-containing protein 12
MEVARMPADRIVLVGQSLGTAVMAGVIEHFAERGTEFAGVILISGFTKLQSLLADYCLLGWLSPLRSYPRLLEYFTNRVYDRWSSVTRVANFVRLSKRVRLFIIHSRNDYEILWYHSDGLFAAAVNATADGGIDLALLEQIKRRNTMDMGDGAFISTWKGDGDKIIREEIVSYGRQSCVNSLGSVFVANNSQITVGY